MSVTKTDPLLAKLATFLNFKFETATPTTLKQARLNFYELDRPGSRQRGLKLQEEIRLDLTPLLSETPTDEMHERDKLIKLRQTWQEKKGATKSKQS